MKFKFIPIFIVALLALSTIASATRSNDQETPNSKYTYGTWKTVANLYDESWTTYSKCTTGSKCRYKMNYTKETDALATSYWVVKHGNESYTNTSPIAIPTTCWALNPVRIVVQIDNATDIKIVCLKAAGNTTMYIDNSVNVSFYEEKMVWLHESQLQDMMADAGDGLGNLFTGFATPLGTLVIILAAAGAVGTIMFAMAYVIKVRLGG